MKKYKIKLFTHDSDMDGRGAYIIACIIFGKENVDVEFCEPYPTANNINTMVRKSDCFSGEYDFVFITDLSLDEETAKYFDEKARELKGKTYFKLIDHHATALELNKYDWAIINVDREFFAYNNDGSKSSACTEPTSGTFEFIAYVSELNKRFSLLKHIDLNKLKNMTDFAHAVRKYDTWLWHKNQEMFPKQFNDLFKILGKNRWTDYCIDSLTKKENGIEFTESDLLQLELYKEKTEQYLKNKNNTIIKHVWKGYNVAFVFAEQNMSELGSYICTNNSDIDFTVLVSPSFGISYRTAKEDIDLSKIAQEMGGGGHKKASGSPINDDQRLRILEVLFNGEEFTHGKNHNRKPTTSE